MTTKKIRAIGAVALIAVWAALTVFAWLKPADAVSDAERRPLAQFPELNADTVLSGDFMTEFESYTLDQFPFRDSFRQLKALFHYNVMGQKDNNGIYIAEGYAAKLEYPLNTAGVNKALEKFNYIYDTYLKETGSTVFTAVIPDKGYYLAEENGYPAMDYEKLFSTVQESMPWSTHIDLTDCLSQEDYYKTDTHWRQEKLIPAAQKIRSSLGVSALKESEWVKNLVDRPFYGVYYGQAALPMEPDTMTTLQNPMLDDCVTYAVNWDAKTNAPVTEKLYDGVYDWNRQDAKDLYEVYLSGPQAMLVIENPNAATDRELILFRDSFGSSLAPLLVQDYAKVTVVDIRYVPSNMLSSFITFEGQDVLFAYSTLILNSGSALK